MQEGIHGREEGVREDVERDGGKEEQESQYKGTTSAALDRRAGKGRDDFD